MKRCRVPAKPSPISPLSTPPRCPIALRACYSCKDGTYPSDSCRRSKRRKGPSPHKQGPPLASVASPAPFQKERIALAGSEFHTRTARVAIFLLLAERSIRPEDFLGEA